jgi:hypothetical protein
MILITCRICGHADYANTPMEIFTVELAHYINEHWDVLVAIHDSIGNPAMFKATKDYLNIIARPGELP